MPGTQDLFDVAAPPEGREQLAPGAWLLRGFALDGMTANLAAIDHVQASAPFRHWVTRGGFRMSVAMTNCGGLGWVSDPHGYRYDPCDPLTGRAWPAMPSALLRLAQAAASAAEYPTFVPDACLLNRYVPGARLTLHQDKDERDFDAPIVSVSLGLPAVFLFGGDARTDRHRRVRLHHGDVVVWGGAARLRHHGVLALKEGHHEVLGSQRLNLTFRKAG
jgi:alkylated DNA repair protein (DNA oxidative demethylase)